MMNDKLDFLLCSLPKNDLSTPLLGLALLNAVLKKNGYTSKFIDFNNDLGQIYESLFPSKDWDDLEGVFSQETLFNEYYDIIKPFIDDCVKIILDHSPTFVGFGAFTTRNSLMIEHISREIKKKSDIKIIIGGSNTNRIGPELYNNGLIDYFVLGEGEDAILHIARGEPFHGVNDSKLTPSVNMDDNPPADYSDLDLSKYSNSLYITGTRSCPRSCSFCEVPYLWGKFRTKSPKNILNEIRHHCQHDNIRKFYFTDSLINGSMSHFREFTKLLADERRTGNNFSWRGFVIIRNEKQMTPSDFDLLAESGCKHVKIGVESGSEKIREHMKKGFKSGDIDYTLEQLKRVGVCCNFLLMVGYPTETDDDFNQTKEMLLRYKQYTLDGTINHIRISPVFIVEQTPLYDAIGELGISGPIAEWSNDIVSYETRYKRYLELRDFIYNNGYTIINQKDKEMLSLVNTDLKNIEEDDDDLC